MVSVRVTIVSADIMRKWRAFSVFLSIGSVHLSQYSVIVAIVPSQSNSPNSEVCPVNLISLSVRVRARLHYVTKPCDFGHFY